MNSTYLQPPEFPPFQPPDEPGEQVNWPRFFIVLLAPAVTTLVSLFLNLESGVMAFTFGGSLFAGFVCSSMLRRGREEAFGKWAFRAIALAAASFFICFGGCVAVIAIASR